MKSYEVIILITCCLGAYVIGSIPIGYIIARFAGVDDIRTHGSGNIGATNVARTLGPSYFVPVFLLDIAKAYGTVALCTYLFPQPYLFYATAAAYLIGNGYSLFLHGSGGKGVAATVGILAAYNPYLLVPIFATWCLFFAKTRTVGVASVGAALCAPLCTYLLAFSLDAVLFVTGISSWIVIKHYENIKNYFTRSYT